MKETHSQWKKASDHSISKLNELAQMCAKKFNAPLNQHHWRMKWCKDAHNFLVMDKLKWRAPNELLTGHTPDMSVLKHHT